MTLTRFLLGGLLVGATALVGCGEDQVVTADVDPNALPAGNATSAEAVSATPLDVVTPDFVDNSNFFSHACSAAGTGTAPGNQVGDFSLTNCLGEQVALHDYCGRRKAVTLVNSAGWCGACRASMPTLAIEQQEGRRSGSEFLVIWGEKDDSSPADEAFCNQVADQYGLDPARTFFDPGFANFQSRFDVVAPGEDSYGLPFHAIVDPYDMTYFWSSSVPEGSEDDARATLLAD
ncbi:MAG: thiol-disulfide isomerase/thioredoxin [Bradymonadia bacterium]|jgi:thiol-disulfide isomerase/thioredoxin